MIILHSNIIFISKHIVYISLTISVKPLRSNHTNVSIVNPYVHLLGDDAAAIAYVKVVQSIDK